MGAVADDAQQVVESCATRPVMAPQRFRFAVSCDDWLLAQRVRSRRFDLALQVLVVCSATRRSDGHRRRDAVQLDECPWLRSGDRQPACMRAAILAQHCTGSTDAARHPSQRTADRQHQQGQRSDGDTAPTARGMCPREPPRAASDQKSQPRAEVLK
jgi:hypothetical protein